MRAVKGRILAIALAGGTACTGIQHATPPTQSPSTSFPSTASSPPAAVPNPFTITSRYSAASLGLKGSAILIRLAVGPNGDVYLVDSDDHVTMVSPAGEPLDRWGGTGTGPGKFRFAESGVDTQAYIAVGPNGDVYVTDSGNARIQVFSPTGEFLRQIGSYGVSDGQFLAPTWVAVDPAGDVYVADDQLQTLSKFSPGGRLVWSRGGPGSVYGHPIIIGNVDPHGRLVIHGKAGRILYLDTEGRVVESFGFHLGCTVNVDTAGNTYVYARYEDCGPGPTLLFDHRHHLVGSWSRAIPGLAGGVEFGPNGEAFAIVNTANRSRSLVRVRVSLPGT
jgi:NHL repeat